MRNDMSSPWLSNVTSRALATASASCRAYARFYNSVAAPPRLTSDLDPLLQPP